MAAKLWNWRLGAGFGLSIGALACYVFWVNENRAVCFLPAGSPLQVTKIKPGSYESAAGPPPLPAPVEVDDSLIAERQPDWEMIAQAKKEFPKLLTEAMSDEEQNELMSKQNSELQRNYGDFKRQRAERIADYEQKRAEKERKHDER